MVRIEKRNKVVLVILRNIIFIMIIISLIGMGGYTLAEELPKAKAPKFRTSGTYFIKKGNKYSEKITSDGGSIIFYTMSDTKDPYTEGSKYTKPVQINVNESVISAVNTKEGYQNSDKVSRYYSFSYASPPPPDKSIKVKKIKKGTKKIRGTLKFKSKITVYVKFKVKMKKGKTKIYKVKVKNGQWSVKLKKPLKKGDKVTVSAYTKKYMVHLTKDKNNKDRMNAMIEFIPNSTWIPVKKKIK